MIALFLFTTNLTLLGYSIHDLGLDVFVDADKVRIEAFFADDSVPKGTPVQILDSKGKIIAEGKTDSNGQWSFPRPAPGEYTARIDAGSGHKTKTRFSVPAKKK